MLIPNAAMFESSRKVYLQGKGCCQLDDVRTFCNCWPLFPLTWRTVKREVKSLYLVIYLAIKSAWPAVHVLLET